ncbi:MAG TPA: TolC family protein [Limnochordales bacterium]
MRSWAEAFIDQARTWRTWSGRAFTLVALVGLLASAPAGMAASAGLLGGEAAAGAAVDQGAAAKELQASPGAEAIKLTLAGAVQGALLHAPELNLARLAVAEAEIGLREAVIGRMAGQPESVYREARDKLQEARDAYIDQLVQVALRVEEAYYNALRAGELFEIQSSNLDQSARQLAVARARYEAGLIARQDLLEAELSHEQSRLALETTERDRQEAYRKLAELLGMAEGTPLWLVDEITFSPLRMELDDALQEALAQRAEVVRAQRAIEQAREQVAHADTPYAAPVELLRAQYNLERAEIRYEQVRAQVAQQVRQEWHQLADGERRVELSRRQEELAKSRAEISRARYEAGLISLLDLLKDEAAYARARLDAAQAVWDYNLAKARFLRTLGRPELPPLPDPIREYIDSWEELE